jgi:hypothetical protein
LAEQETSAVSLAGGGLGLLDAISAFVVGLIEILFQNSSANQKGELTHCRLAKKYLQASRILKHCQNPSSKFRMLSLFLAQLFWEIRR